MSERGAWEVVVITVASAIVMGVIGTVSIIAKHQWPEQSVSQQSQSNRPHKNANYAPLPIPDKIKADSKDDRAQRASTEQNEGGMNWPAWIEAIATLVTCAFTAILAVATVRLWNSTKGLHDETKRLAELAERQAKDTRASISVATRAAEAAELTAKAGLSVNLPIVHIERIEIGAIPKEEDKMAEWCKSVSPKIVVRNFGRTQAFLKSSSINAAVGSLPDAPVYDPADESGENRVIAQDESYEIERWDFAGEKKFTFDQLRKIAARKVPLRFYGFVTFKDFIGQEHCRGFIYEAVGGLCIDNSTEYPKYDYDR